MKGICIIGRKGGTGKSTLSHAIGLGAALLKIPAYVIHTDNQAFPENAQERPYALLDGRTPESLMDWINKAAEREDGLLVIDGAAGRGDLDIKIAEYMDLVLIPVIPSGNAIDEAIQHSERVPNSYFLINNMPTNKFRRKYVVDRYFNRLDNSKIIGTLPKTESVDLLTDLKGDFIPSPKTRSFSRQAFLMITKHPHINIDLLDMLAKIKIGRRTNPGN